MNVNPDRIWKVAAAVVGIAGAAMAAEARFTKLETKQEAQERTNERIEKAIEAIHRDVRVILRREDPKP